MMSGSLLVNLGCGDRCRPGWVNIDYRPRVPGVMAWDLRRGIPLGDDRCRVVYHAAMLEHLGKSEALPFLKECHRVLAGGGTIRVGTPDLERLCQDYLLRLKRCLEEDRDAEGEYDWILMEMLDQMVRDRPGGDMLDFVQTCPRSMGPFLLCRIGEDARQMLRETAPPGGRSGTERRSWWPRARAWGRNAGRRLIERGLSADDRHCLALGRFHASGEKHLWLYDRYSLGRLLAQAGFENATVQSAATSSIIDWDEHRLDTLPDGTILKPDLFFMEATKPRGEARPGVRGEPG